MPAKVGYACNEHSDLARRVALLEKQHPADRAGLRYEIPASTIPAPAPAVSSTRPSRSTSAPGYQSALAYRGPTDNPVNVNGLNYYRQPQRISLNGSNAVTVAASTNAFVSTAAASGGVLNLATNQAFRIIHFHGEILDDTGTGQLSVQSARLKVYRNFGLAPLPEVVLFPWPGSGFATVTNTGVGGQTGPIAISYIPPNPDEIIAWNDYQEFGGLTPSVNFIIEASVLNLDAGAGHGVRMNIWALLEMWNVGIR